MGYVDVEVTSKDLLIVITDFGRIEVRLQKPMTRAEVIKGAQRGGAVGQGPNGKTVYVCPQAIQGIEFPQRTI